MSGIAPNSPRYMIFPHCFQIGTFTLNLGTRFLLGGRIVTPGYSGHWPGDSGRGVSISIIWSSGPHNHLNRKYHSLSLSLPLSPVTSLSLTSLTNSPSPQALDSEISHFNLIPRPRELHSAWGNHLLQVFHLEMVSFSSFSCNGSLLKVPKLGLNGLIILGCFKRFLLGQSSSYESLY